MDTFFLVVGSKLVSVFTPSAYYGILLKYLGFEAHEVIYKIVAHLLVHLHIIMVNTMCGGLRRPSTNNPISAVVSWLGQRLRPLAIFV